MSLKRVYLLTCFGEATSIAPSLLEEGVDVVVGQIQDMKDTVTCCEKYKPEDPEEKKRRLTVGDGIAKKVTAQELVKMVNSDPKPEEAFVFTDLNICWKYAEQMKDSGVMGIYPTEEDRMMEVDREKMKELFAKHYKKLSVGEMQEFNKIEEAKKFLEETEDAWVLKGNDVDAKTIVPDTEDSEKAKVQVEEALESGADKYEKSGFILEKKIKGVQEITPQLIFVNGKPVSATIDIELKRQFAGDIGPLCGCAADLVFPVKQSSEIIKMAFPPFVYDMAKGRSVFYFDCSILFDPKTGEAYAGEVCSNRPGWNSVLTEMSLAGGVKRYLEALKDGKDPLDSIDALFGVSVRVFNPNKEPEGAEQDREIEYEENTSIFLLDAKKEDDDCVTAGYQTDLAVATGTGDTIQAAAKRAYMNLQDLTFEGKVYRPLQDLMSRTYKTSIPNRFDYGKKKGLFFL